MNIGHLKNIRVVGRMMQRNKKSTAEQGMAKDQEERRIDA